MGNKTAFYDIYLDASVTVADFKRVPVYEVFSSQ